MIKAPEIDFSKGLRGLKGHFQNPTSPSQYILKDSFEDGIGKTMGQKFSSK